MNNSQYADTAEQSMAEDTPTVLRHVSIRRQGNQDYVVYDLRREANATIARMAGDFRLRPEQVLDYLLTNPANAHVIPQLYRNAIRGRYPGLAAARRTLRRRAQQPLLTQSGGRTIQIQVYLTWELNITDTRQPILLPLSDAYRQYLTGLARASHQRQFEPIQQRIRQRLSTLRQAVWRLQDAANNFRNAIRPHAAEVGVIRAIEGMLGLMIHNPRQGENPSASDLRDARDLQQRTASLSHAAHQHYILRPSHYMNLLQTRDRLAAALMRELEGSRITQDVLALLENREVADPDVFNEAGETLAACVRVLATTPQADALLERHIMPLIDLLASRNIDVSWLPASEHDDFANAVRRASPAPPRSNSIVVLIGGLAGTAPYAVGNLPGPSSLCLAVMEAAGPLLLPRYQQLANVAPALAAKILRAFVASTGLRGSEASQLFHAVRQQDIAAIRRARWARTFMRGRGFGALMAICCLISMILTIRNDDPATIRYWAAIIAGATGTALGLSRVFTSMGTLFERGAFLGLRIGEVLGVVAAMATVVVASYNAAERFRMGDTMGGYLGIAEAVGGTITVAGFIVGALVSAGLVADATIIGVPLGTFLMILGGVIALGAALWSLIRDLTQEGTRITFEQFMNHFAREDGPYPQIARLRPALRTAYDAVNTRYRGIDFWKITPSISDSLYDLGFSVGHIARITDTDEGAIRRRLRQASRLQESVSNWTNNTTPAFNLHSVPRYA